MPRELILTPVATAVRERRRAERLSLRAATLWIGVLSLPGVALGTALANALSERTLKLFFAALLIVLAIGLARRALRRADD